MLAEAQVFVTGIRLIFRFWAHRFRGMAMPNRMWSPERKEGTNCPVWSVALVEHLQLSLLQMSKIIFSSRNFRKSRSRKQNRDSNCSGLQMSAKNYERCNILVYVYLLEYQIVSWFQFPLKRRWVKSEFEFCLFLASNFRLTWKKKKIENDKS